MKLELITTNYQDNIRETTKTYHEFTEESGKEMQVINIYPDIEYQRILGFGGAITEASGYTFSKMSDIKKQELLTLYFGEEGNRYTMVRGHMDSCDFSLDNYSAMSNSKDEELKTFTLDRDEKYILPLMLAAQVRSGRELDLMLSPWSPPAFMKTNGEKNHGGKLKPEYRKLWAEYICRYINEYRKRGLNVKRITVQNEPKATQIWDSCTYSSEEEKLFVRDYLYPTLIHNNLSDVKINIWDHNKERLYERTSEIIDQDTNPMINGVAFHWYSGDHFEAIKITKEAFPDKELIFTEGCVEYSRFDTNRLKNAQMYAHDMIGNLNAGMTGFIDWNIILDEKGGPNHVNNYCEAPIMCDTKKDTYEQKLSFFYIGHFSKYIDQGARRIAFTKYSDQLEMTAFKNPNGTIVLVVLNRLQKDMPMTLRIQGKEVSLTISKEVICTILLSILVPDPIKNKSKCF